MEDGRRKTEAGRTEDGRKTEAGRTEDGEGMSGERRWKTGEFKSAKIPEEICTHQREVSALFCEFSGNSYSAEGAKDPHVPDLNVL